MNHNIYVYPRSGNSWSNLCSKNDINTRCHVFFGGGVVWVGYFQSLSKTRHERNVPVDYNVLTITAHPHVLQGVLLYMFVYET